MSVKSTALTLFDDADVQMDITRSVRVDYYPVHNIIANAPIEFNITGSPDEYIDLGDIRILLHLKITKKDKKPWAGTEKVAFINQPISSIFQDVFLKIADNQVEGGQHLYPYNAYLSSLLQFHPSAKKTHMQAWGWNEDTPGKFDDYDNNDGIRMRGDETKDGKTWEIMGPLFLDMTRQPRYLLPATNMFLKLLPAKPEFALIATADNYDYVIEKCELQVPRVAVMDSVISGHNKGLDKHNAKYLLNHIDISTFTITKDQRSFIKDGLFQAQVPKLLVIGFVEHSAFNGDLKKNPFNFKNYNLNKIGLYRDGELVPGQILTPDYEDNFFTRAYNQTMSALNYFNTDDSNGMTMEHFKDGYNLYAFDLTPDGSAQGPHRHLMRTGSLRLELAFKKNLSTAVTVILFGVIDAKLEITKLRDVLVTYAR